MAGSITRQAVALYALYVLFRQDWCYLCTAYIHGLYIYTRQRMLVLEHSQHQQIAPSSQNRLALSMLPFVTPYFHIIDLPTPSLPSPHAASKEERLHSCVLILLSPSVCHVLTVSCAVRESPARVPKSCGGSLAERIAPAAHTSANAGKPRPVVARGVRCEKQDKQTRSNGWKNRCTPWRRPLAPRSLPSSPVTPNHGPRRLLLFSVT